MPVSRRPRRSGAALVPLLFALAACGGAGGFTPFVGGGDGGPPPGSDGGVPGGAICPRYLACAAVAAPEALPSLQQGYGPSGTCWKADPTMCETACRAGLDSLRRTTGANKPECGCRDDGECTNASNPVCDLMSGRCAACSGTKGCMKDRTACVREYDDNNKRFNYSCVACSGQPGSESVCIDPFAGSFACTFSGGLPTCRPNGGGGMPCFAVAFCLGSAPIGCAERADCCGQSMTPAAGALYRCAAKSCPVCISARAAFGGPCMDCLRVNCPNEQKACPIPGGG